MIPEYLAAKRCSSSGPIVPGSEKVKCSQCGDVVWLSPASLAHLKARPQTKVVCFDPCAALLGIVEVRVLPGSAEETRQYIEAKRAAREN